MSEISNFNYHKCIVIPACLESVLGERRKKVESVEEDSEQVGMNCVNMQIFLHNYYQKLRSLKLQHKFV